VGLTSRTEASIAAQGSFASVASLTALGARTFIARPGGPRCSCLRLTRPRLGCVTVC